MKTVSRVLNAEPAVAVSTAERVREAAARLGFQRNEAAAHLRRLDRSTRLLGLVSEDLKNPFYSALASAVEGVARQNGYLLIVASSDENADTERGVLSALITRRVDGLIVVPTGTDHSFLIPEIDSGTAVVFVDRPALAEQVDCVIAANAEGAVSAVQHLLDHGHRRIGYLGDNPGISTAQERYRGYRDGLTAAGRPVDDSLVRLGLHDTAAAEDACRELLAATHDPVTAIFAGNNRLTIGAVHAIANQARPVALIGFDDFELADVLRPAVTVVAQDVDAMGRTATELLLRRLAGDRRPATRVTLATRLIPGDPARYALSVALSHPVLSRRTVPLKTQTTDWLPGIVNRLVQSRLAHHPARGPWVPCHRLQELPDERVPVVFPSCIAWTRAIGIASPSSIRSSLMCCGGGIQATHGSAPDMRRGAVCAVKSPGETLSSSSQASG